MKTTSAEGPKRTDSAQSGTKALFVYGPSPSALAMHGHSSCELTRVRGCHLRVSRDRLPSSPNGHFASLVRFDPDSVDVHRLGLSVSPPRGRLRLLHLDLSEGA